MSGYLDRGDRAHADALAAFEAGDRAGRPGVLGDAWRDGYTTAQARCRRVLSVVQDEVDSLRARPRTRPDADVVQQAQHAWAEQDRHRDADPARRAPASR